MHGEITADLPDQNGIARTANADGAETGLLNASISRCSPTPGSRSCPRCAPHGHSATNRQALVSAVAAGLDVMNRARVFMQGEIATASGPSGGSDSAARTRHGRQKPAGKYNRALGTVGLHRIGHLPAYQECRRCSSADGGCRPLQDHPLRPARITWAPPSSALAIGSGPIIATTRPIGRWLRR